MTITEYLNSSRGERCFAYSYARGANTTVKEFYDNFIHERELPRENVLKWHKMFVEYAQKPDAIFMVRMYESADPKYEGRDNNRRACVTKCPDGFSYVFISNFDVHEIFNMVARGVEPNLEEFHELMTTFSYKMHYDNSNSWERDLAAYPCLEHARNRSSLSKCKFYLAHINGIKDRPFVSNFPKTGLLTEIRIDSNDLLPRGLVSAWEECDGVKKRILTDSLSNQQKDIVKALFFRTVDPLNYFLVPGKNAQSFNNPGIRINKNNIGETLEMTKYVFKKFKEKYGAEAINEFVHLAMLGDVDSSATGVEQINITYDPNFTTMTPAQSPSSRAERTIVRSNAVSNGFTEQQQAKCLRAYLFDGLSFRRLEREVLGINSEDRGGGYKAQTIVRNFGLVASDKNKFRGQDLDFAMAHSDGDIQNALIYIRQHLD